MIEIIASVKPYLEVLYFLSGILLLAGIGLTYRQLLLIKRDIRTRNERAAAEKSIEACDRYFSSYVPLSAAYLHDKQQGNLNGYKGPFGDFSPDSLPESIRKECSKRFSLSSWLPAMNQLESISAYFICGVADECTGFRVIGRTFCGSIENNYDVISLCRREKAHAYWSNAVELYNLWRPRLEKAEIDIAMKEMEMKASLIHEKSISPIGVSG